MTDDQIIIAAEKLGFSFIKHKDSWNWTAKAPDGDFITIEQGEKRGMQWVKEKLIMLKLKIKNPMV